MNTWLSKEALKFVHDALVVGLSGEQSDELPKETQQEVWQLVEELDRLMEAAK